MKKNVKIILSFCLAIVVVILLPAPVKAANTFSCNFLPSSNGQSNDLVIRDVQCQPGYTTSQASCFNTDYDCPAAADGFSYSITCIVPCIPESEAPINDIAWGQTCSTTDIQSQCVSGTTCRRATDNSYRCLKGQQSVTRVPGSDPTCYDSTECSGYSPGSGINFTCSNSGGNQGSCFNSQGPRPEEVTTAIFEVCNQIPENFNGGMRDTCIECQENEGIWTAIGCIEAQPQSIVATVVRIGLGLAGGVAILMILAAAFLFSTSQGDPKRTTQARDLITSAVIGLLFIIFSVTILQFIGVSILQIPDFGI